MKHLKRTKVQRQPSAKCNRSVQNGAEVETSNAFSVLTVNKSDSDSSNRLLVRPTRVNNLKTCETLDPAMPPPSNQFTQLGKPLISVTSVTLKKTLN